MGKQAYKLDLPICWKIYDVFHVSLLEHSIKRKKQVNELQELKPKLKVREDVEYKVEVIKDNIVYTTETIG